MGPVTYMVVEFPGSQFKGEIAPALRELVDNRQIRIMDLVLVKKNADGSIESVELSRSVNLTQSWQRNLPDWRPLRSGS